MRVRLTCGRAGAHWVQNENDVVDVDDREARHLLKSGQAVAVPKSTPLTSEVEAQTAAARGQT
jgi:hypothetical protein